MVPFFIGVGVLVFVGLMVLGYVARAQRRKALAAWAAGQGLAFDPERDDSMDERFGEFACLCQGSDRYAYNIATGERQGRGVCAFDYHYQTTSAGSKGQRHTQHHYLSAVIIQTDLPLKGLLIRPEGLLDKISEFFGLDDVDFESAEFSRRFYVKAADRKWAFDVISQETMEFLLAMPTFTVEMSPGDGNGCVLATGLGTLSVVDLDAALRVVEGILDRLPRSLVQAMKGEG